MQHNIFCVREFIKTASPTAVQRAFRLRFNIQPPTRNSICRWNHQFEQIGCLCKGKSSGRPRVSEETVRRIQESFECSPCKSTRRASRELGIPQPTVWHVLRRHLLFNRVHLFESPCTISWGGPQKQIFIQNFVKTGQQFQKLVGWGGNRHTCVHTHTHTHNTRASTATCSFAPGQLVLSPILHFWWNTMSVSDKNPFFLS